VTYATPTSLPHSSSEPHKLVHSSTPTSLGSIQHFPSHPWLCLASGFPNEFGMHFSSLPFVLWIWSYSNNSR
jgi:hypothetical protein